MWPQLDGHLHGNGLVRIVPNQLKILNAEIVDGLHWPLDKDLGERTGSSCSLLPQSIHVRPVNVRIAGDVDKLGGAHPHNMRNHHRQKGVAGNVKGHPQTHITTPLVHLAGEQETLVRVVLWGLRNVKLGKHVTWREGHQGQIPRIPRTHHDPPIKGIPAEGIDDLLQLVHALPRIIRMHVPVLGPKVPPLKSINGTQVALLTMPQATPLQKLSAPIRIPNVDVTGCEVLGVGVPANEPQEFLQDALIKDSLGGQQGQDVVVEGEAELPAKDCDRSGASTVRALLAICKDVPNQVQVLHFIQISGWRWKNVGICWNRAD